MKSLLFFSLVVATQAPDAITTEGAKESLALAAAAAAVIRMLMWLAKKPLPFVGVLMDRVPKELRVVVVILLAALAGALEHFAGGGSVLEAVAVAAGAFTFSEGSYRAQVGRKKRLEMKRAGSLNLSDRGHSG